MAVEPARLHLRIVSYNIRYAIERPRKGEEPWHVRCPKLCTQLSFIAVGHENAFICLQEVVYSQLLDIRSRLRDGWSHIGRGRGKNAQDGELLPILYRSDVWKLVESETRWLSETPEQPSKGWDAALSRIVTIGRFAHREKGAEVVIMNTHFDHVGVKARELSAELICQLAHQWDQDTPARPSVTLIAGDLNSTPSDKAYQIMISPTSGMSDVFNIVPRDQRYGNELTYTGFNEKRDTPGRIDFLFIREPRTANLLAFGVLPNIFDDGTRISDHRPVVANMSILA